MTSDYNRHLLMIMIIIVFFKRPLVVTKHTQSDQHSYSPEIQVKTTYLYTSTRVDETEICMRPHQIMSGVCVWGGGNWVCKLATSLEKCFLFFS